MAVMAPKPKKPRTSAIYRWRMGKKWTQKELANEFGVELRTVQRWEEAAQLSKRNQLAFERLKAKYP